MPYALELSDEDLEGALKLPRQKHNLLLADVKQRLEKVVALWQHLGELASLAERADFTSSMLSELEKRAIQLNIFWRDTFGMRDIVDAELLLL